MMIKGIIAPINEIQMKTVRPDRSDKNPSIISPMINPKMVIVKARLDVETDILKSSTNTGEAAVLHTWMQNEERSQCKANGYFPK